MSNLSVYNLGQLGVNVDKDPIHLEDGELTSAQNAIKDPLGVVGGITKRLGLTKFNSVAGAGSIAGGIGVPLTHPSTFTIYLGRSSTSGGLGAAIGWWKSTDAFVTAASTITSNPAAPRANEIATFSAGALSTLGGSPGVGCIVNNVLYYAASNYTSAAPPIRAFDGTLDREICRVPINPDVGTNSVGVLSMITANGSIYISTYDGGTTSADFKGRVLSLNPATGVLTPVGATFTTGHLPYALATSGNTLWVGSHNGNSSSNGNAYFFRVGSDTTWTLDNTFSVGNVCSVLAYGGDIYFGHMQAAGTFATISKRTSLGVYSTADTASSGTARNANAYLGMTTFGSNLYAAYWNNDTTPIAIIRKFNGSSWSSVFTAATSATRKPFNAFFQLNSVLYSCAGGLGTSAGLLSTSNGTSWTDLSGSLTTDTSVPAFIGFYS